MTASSADPSPIVVVTGANGLVGSRVCEMLSASGASVRAVVRRSGSAPRIAGVEELVGDFGDPTFAHSVVQSATAVVSTVHPMGSDEETQRQVAVQGTPVLARAAREAGVARLVHISTAAVYDRSPETGDVDESSALVGDDAGDYAVTKRDTDAALAEIGGITTVLLRPPAILGSGPRSTWNALRPAAIRDHEAARRVTPDQTFAWVALDDLCALAADLATGRIPTADDPAAGPLEGSCTPLNVAGSDYATVRVYHETVCGILGVEPAWQDAPAWTGLFLADRAREWGWSPAVNLADALAELENDLRG
ncbi:MAG: NAD(P)-dependent oxidoreductase [Propionibacteriaceae bacterium]|nr:NAD(P)-dependent oxidoreductase [Propionibacteriaceae bacterium]